MVPSKPSTSMTSPSVSVVALGRVRPDRDLVVRLGQATIEHEEADVTLHGLQPEELHVVALLAGAQRAGARQQRPRPRRLRRPAARRARGRRRRRARRPCRPRHPRSTRRGRGRRRTDRGWRRRSRRRRCPPARRPRPRRPAEPARLGRSRGGGPWTARRGRGRATGPAGSARAGGGDPGARRALRRAKAAMRSAAAGDAEGEHGEVDVHPAVGLEAAQLAGREPPRCHDRHAGGHQPRSARGPRRAGARWPPLGRSAQPDGAEHRPVLGRARWCGERSPARRRPRWRCRPRRRR